MDLFLKHFFASLVSFGSAVASCSLFLIEPEPASGYSVSWQDGKISTLSLYDMNTLVRFERIMCKTRVSIVFKIIYLHPYGSFLPPTCLSSSWYRPLDDVESSRLLPKRVLVQWPFPQSSEGYIYIQGLVSPMLRHLLFDQLELQNEANDKRKEELTYGNKYQEVNYQRTATLHFEDIL